MTSQTPVAQGNAPRCIMLSTSEPSANAVILPLPLGQGRAEGLLRSRTTHRPVLARKRRASFAPRRSRGFTLIEILVSLTITMMMMGAVVTLFGVMTDSVSGSRAVIEMSERLRACRNRLQADLVGATATMKPPLLPENDEGYFELIEGPDSDLNYQGTNVPNSIFGDADDVLMFTVRSRAEPFVGKFNNPPTTATVESQVAEVIYFAVRNGPTVVLSTGTVQLYTLYRRVLLVAPGVGNQAVSTAFYDSYDLSVRFQQIGGTYFAVPNTLGDLTKRENRFAHLGAAAFPPVFPFNVNNVVPPSLPAALPQSPNNPAALTPLINTRLGDEILMTNMLAFDVQVYDPNAPVKVSTTNPTGLSFSDAGFANVAAPPTAFGGYVDLGYAFSPGGGTPVPFFNLNNFRAVTVSTTNPVPLLPSLPLPQIVAGPPSTYDTWSLHYENDGLPEPTGAATQDLGLNGLDDNANGIVDDLSEYDTQPPFAAPLRGIRVIIRVYEPSSQQVREVTVVQDFLPE